MRLQRSSFVAPLTLLCLFGTALPLLADEQPKTHTVAAGPVEMILELDGVVTAKAFQPIRYEGKVLRELKIKQVAAHGSRVRQGAVLVEPDTEDIEKDLADRKLAVKLGAVELKLAELKLAHAEQTQPRQIEKLKIALERVAADLNQFLEKGKALAIADAKESMLSGQDRLAYARETLKQLQQMYKADDLTEETEEIILRRTQDDLRRAEHALARIAEKSRVALEHTIPRREQDARRAVGDAELALKQAQQSAELTLQEQRLNLEKKRVAQEKAERDLKDALADFKKQTIAAPADGIVYHGEFDQRGVWKGAGNNAALKPASTIAADKIVMTLLPEMKTGVVAAIPEKQLAHVMKDDSPVTVLPAAYPHRRLSGTLNALPVLPRSDGTFGGTITLAEDDLLAPGMTCKVQLVIHRAESGIVVPEQAVFARDSGWYVNVQTDTGLQKRSVTLGPTHDGRAVITEGLKTGETLILDQP